MNKLAKLVFAAASAAIALSATAQEVKDIKVRPNSLYLQDGRDVVTRSGYGLSATYALSKRTYIYADYVTNGATVSATSTSAQKNMTSLGLVHNF